MVSCERDAKLACRTPADFLRLDLLPLDPALTRLVAKGGPLMNLGAVSSIPAGTFFPTRWRSTTAYTT